MDIKVKILIAILSVGVLLGTVVISVDWSRAVENLAANDSSAESGKGSVSALSLPAEPPQDAAPPVPQSEVREAMPEEGHINPIAIDDELALLALFETQDSQVASAVVLVNGYGAYRYSVGNKVAGKYLLSQIAPDHVVLDVEGKQFRLFLTPLAGGERSQLETIENGPVNGSGILERTRAERERMRLLSAYDLYPVVDGAAAGYVIGERFPRNVREQVGIEPGDILLSVNGFPLGLLEGDEQAFLSVQRSMKATIVFQRQDGSIFDYHYSEDAKAP